LTEWSDVPWARAAASRSAAASSSRASGVGAGGTLEKALNVAYQNARGSQGGRKTYRVAHIYVTGDNPISEYTVIVAAPA
jgi:hypothetical protein